MQHSCEETLAATSRSTEHLRFKGRINRVGCQIFRLRSYPAWRVKVNGQAIWELPRREVGLILVPIAAGALNLTAE